MKLSIIIPVFNEEKTIIDVLKKLDTLYLSNVRKEIIIVDDASTDNTVKKITNYELQITNFVLLRHTENLGKGAAIRTGLRRATGEYIIIQDADLEYNPEDISRLLVPILEKKATVVYGTRLNRMPRFSHEENHPQFFLHYIGNRLLSLLTSMLYRQWITDMETCYKIFPREALEDISLHAKRFDFEPEITAKLLKKGYHITEIPITTKPRGYKEGKKLRTVRDGCSAVWSIIKYRFVD